jgi:hypothetical protein
MKKRTIKSKTPGSATVLPPFGLHQSLIAMFLISLSLILFQIVITRVFSAILLYHYVFLVTSFAILGLGLGGMMVYKYQKISAAFSANPSSFLANTGLILSGAYFLIITIISLTPFMGGFIPYILLCLIPFIIGGVFISTLFKFASQSTSKLYFADLTGSAIGSLVVVYSLDSFGVIRSFLLICLIAAIAALVMSIKNLKSKSFAVTLAFSSLLSVLFFQTNLAGNLEKNFKPFITNPEKYVGDVDRERGAGAARIIYTKWNSFSRTDVIDVQGDPDRKTVTIDGVAFSGMYRYGGDPGEIKKYTDTSGYFPSIMSLPFRIGNNDNVVMIGAGGGRDVLYALLAGSKTIAAVEINRSTIDAVRHFAAFNGNIYDRPEVKVYPEDGRTFISRSPEKYDLIFLSLVKTEAIGTVAFSLTENFIYTTGALEDYLNHLNEDGKIAFIVHHEASLAKLTATALNVFKKKGMEETEIPLHLAIINSKNLETNPLRPTYQPLLIIKKKPFTETEARQLLDAGNTTGNSCLFMPYLQEVARLGEIRQGTATVADFEKDLPYNAEPATDDKPYFYNFDLGLPPVLLITLIGVILLSLVFLIPACKQGLAGFSLYFTGLGIGFMLIEIPLIQKFILYLGHPTLAFAFVLFALLAGGGLGSYWSGLKLWQTGKSKRQLAPLLVVGYAAVLLILAPVVFHWTIDFNSVCRILTGIGLVLPLGFFMGMPFPAGIRRMSLEHLENEVPLMWGVNGVMTVVGSVAAITISMLVGFDWTILVGSLVYLGIFLSNQGVLRGE